MKMEDNIKDTMTARVVKEIKDVDNNVTGVLVPILRDTVADYRKVVNKQFILIVILVAVIALLSSLGFYYIYRQTKEYKEFLSQFDFETEDYIYTQDLDATDGRKYYKYKYRPKLKR